MKHKKYSVYEKIDPYKRRLLVYIHRHRRFRQRSHWPPGSDLDADVRKLLKHFSKLFL